MRLSKTTWFGMLAMAFIVVLSNILVQFLLGDFLTYGAFTYPFAFLVTDLVNRLEGQKMARQVVFTGFLVGVACSFIGTQIHGPAGPLVTVRIALASGTGFLTAQLLDVAIFNALRRRIWWAPPVFSTLISSAVDTLLFFGIAFSTAFIFIEPTNDVFWANEAVPLLGIGSLAPLWVSLAFADYLVKLGLALLALVPYRWALIRMART